MPKVQLERDEFEILAKVMPYLKGPVARRAKAYRISKFIFHGEVIRYNVYVGKMKDENPQIVWRGDNEVDILEEPIEVPADYEVWIEFFGPMSVEVSIVANQAK